jgi:restriction system protein
MPIPDYQSLMLPVLQLAGDGQEHTLAGSIETLAQQFHLSDEERKEMLPSGTQARFDNRVSWAITYLKKAGLLESSGRGRYYITDSGRKTLQGQPERIDVRFLRQFAAFQESQGRNSDPRVVLKPPDSVSQTPQEQLGTIYQALRQDLVNEVLERVKACSPAFFERLVVDLLVAMGYGGSRKDAGQAVGRTADGGIDGIIKEDRLGLDVVLIQAKRWDGTVGRQIVQAFAGSLDGQRAKKGVLLTTSQFSREAKDYVGRIEKRIVLIEGEELAQMMIDHNIGVSEVDTYVIKKVDLDYYEEI